MLGFNSFYWQTTRKSVVSFGNLFKDITLVKYNAITRAKIEQRIVPITYAGKENYLKRLLQQPVLTTPVEVKLPGMSFELLSLAYDPSRKLQSAIQNYNQTVEGPASQYSGVPYNLQFELYIYIRNIDDGLQIVEQIFPFFGPDYTLTMDFIDEMNITRNVPIILNNIQMPTEYEGDATEVERRLVWTLNFTMMTNFYGPVSSPGGPITETITNLISYDTGQGDDVVLTVANTPLGNFAFGETVYQGSSLPQANAVGTVILWNPTGGQLTVNLVSGAFVSNSNVHGTNWGSSVEVLTVPKSIIYAKIIDTPNPNTANNINEDFGFTTQIIEFPYAGSYIPAPGPTPGGGNGGGIGNGSGGSGGNYQVDVYSNGVIEQANAILNFINTSNSEFIFGANGALLDISFVDYQAQQVYNIATAAYSQSNTALVVATTANSVAQSSNTAAQFANNIAILAYTEANLAYIQANVAYTQANTANNTANGAYNQANTAYTIAALAYAEANSVGNTFNVLTTNSLFISTVADFTTFSGSIVANGSSYILDSFSASQFNTVKYIAQLTAPGYLGGSLQSTEILCMQDGTNTFMTEYATLLNMSSLGYFTTTISGSNFQLIFNTYSLGGATINYKALREALST